MLRYLVRYEMARLLFSPVGLAIAVVAAALLVQAQDWALSHPFKAASAAVLALLARRALRAIG